MLALAPPLALLRLRFRSYRCPCVLPEHMAGSVTVYIPHNGWTDPWSCSRQERALRAIYSAMRWVRYGIRESARWWTCHARLGRRDRRYRVEGHGASQDRQEGHSAAAPGVRGGGGGVACV